MKVLIVLIAAVGLSAGRLVPPRNYTYTEGDRYVWVPANEGDEFVLVDTQEPVSEEDLRAAERSGERNEYWLFTRLNRVTRQVLIHENNDSIRGSRYNSALPIMVIVHGFLGKGSHGMNVAITREYLDLVNANVIVLDWSNAATGAYSTAAGNVPSVGRSLGNFLTWLIRNHGGNWNNVHLVGYSLGAHVVGHAGRTAGNQAARITGLDPAGPSFRDNLNNALRRSDARYVESIHTDGEMYGILTAISNADFYPNGGRHFQPGCWVNSCSHSRSHELFAATIRNNRFTGRLCNNLDQVRSNTCPGTRTLNMGNSILTKSGTGLFRLGTTHQWPFF